MFVQIIKIYFWNTGISPGQMLTLHASFWFKRPNAQDEKLEMSISLVLCIVLFFDLASTMQTTRNSGAICLKSGTSNNYLGKYVCY